jgi:hypothetical protein
LLPSEREALVFVLCRDVWANGTDFYLGIPGVTPDKDITFSVLILFCLYLQVKLIKCLVENIVVDISFNQVGGLCTLCFLEEVTDAQINGQSLVSHSVSA